MLFDNATIITMNAEREIILNGAVVIRGSRIEAVGRRQEVAEAYPEEPRLDYGGHILLPGLIDTHVHLSQCLLRGLSEGRPHADLSNWLLKDMFPLMGSYTAEDGLASASLCVLEMLKSGTTGFVEVLLAEHYGMDGIAQMCTRSGIRAALGSLVMDVSPEWRDRMGWHSGMWQTRESSVQGALRAHDRWEGAGDGRIQIWFGCRSAEPANDPTVFDEISALARQRDMGITIHLLEFASDNKYAASQGFRTLGDFAAAHGLLGPRTVLAHCNVSDEGDWKLFVETGTTVSHNPANNSTAGWPAAPIVEMQAAGVNVALGCDGAPTNTNMDLLRDLRTAAHVARVRHGTRTVMRSETILEMATINGARAPGRAGELGSIEPGKLADFITINTDVAHLTPVWNPVSAVVFGAQGADVDTVVINGEIVMQGRQMRTMDEGSILEDVRRRYREVAQRAGISHLRTLWPVLQ